jgi:hypothetical protein
MRGVAGACLVLGLSLHDAMHVGCADACVEAEHACASHPHIDSGCGHRHEPEPSAFEVSGLETKVDCLVCALGVLPIDGMLAIGHPAVEVGAGAPLIGEAAHLPGEVAYLRSGRGPPVCC